MEEFKDCYQSVSGQGYAIFREKASKFIAYGLPASNEEEVKKHLETLRKTHYDANHHCYAYRMGFENVLYRINDDGEPSGSAGKPIYGQILSLGLSDVLVVVIRYFGGTKLGIPGLINAYRTAAREALLQMPVISKTVMSQFNVTFNYPMINEVMRILKEEGVKIIHQSSEERCTITFQIRKGLIDKMVTRFARLKDILLYTN